MENIFTEQNRVLTFQEYQNWLNKWKNNNDFREINIQNEVVKPFILSICPDLDVIDVSTKTSTTIHDYLQYCGTYLGDNSKEKPTTPDLVVSKNWNWQNRKNKVDYRFTVEVKSPFLGEHIYDKDIFDEMKPKIECHLSALQNHKVILTDGLKWIFFNNSFDNPKIFSLCTKNSSEWQWNESSDVFHELKNYIYQFAHEKNLTPSTVFCNSKPNYFSIPINIAYSKEGLQWNYFLEMPKKNSNRTETFLYKEPMKPGDYVLLYITQTGFTQASYKNKTAGVYAIGRILSTPPFLMKDSDDRNKGKTVIQVDIEYYNLDKPLGDFSLSAKPYYPAGEPFIIQNIDSTFLKKISTAKTNATFKPFI